MIAARLNTIRPLQTIILLLSTQKGEGKTIVYIIKVLIHYLLFLEPSQTKQDVFCLGCQAGAEHMI